MKECLYCHGDQEVAVIAQKMGYRPDVAFLRIRELEDLLFSIGAMQNAPCFVCGYSGEGYFDPDIHSCAERHHMLYK